MPADSPFAKARSYQPTETIEIGRVALAALFADAADEYRAACNAAVVFDRSDRGLVTATGADAGEWLHNLVTNDVKALEHRGGAYAFAIDVRGRTRFDLNILRIADRLWLDIDAASVRSALEHLNHFLITEDVQLQDVSGEHARLGCSGPNARRIAADLGVPNFPALAALSSVALPTADDVRFVRHDFATGPGFELIVRHAAAADWWDRLVEQHGAAPAGSRTLDVLRIEAGIPWLGRDIDEHTLPPETGQIERGISYHKGCYLGQEVIERMRSRGALARRLVKLRIDSGEGITPPSPLVQDGKEVGRVTSLVRHPTRDESIGLGYLRTNVTDRANITLADPPRAVSVIPAT